MILNILLPAYNEETTILEVLQKLASIKSDLIEIQVIVIDDGSKDNTKNILNANPQLYHKFIDLKVNLGKGGAVREGLKNCDGDYVLFQDADLEYDPLEIPKIIHVISQFNPDVIYGSRFLAPDITRVAYYYNKCGNRLITLFFNLLYNTTFTDIYSCYLCYKKDLVSPDSLVEDGWSQQAEILGKAVMKGRSFYEVPISYFGRSYEEGKKIRPYHIIGVFKRIFLERFCN